MNIAPGSKGRVNAKGIGAAFDVGERGLGAFFHHIAKLAGKEQFATSLDGIDFNGEHFAANGGPGKSKGHAGREFLFLFIIEKTRRPEVFGNFPCRDFKGAFPAFGYGPGQFAANRGQFPLQIAHTGLAGVFPGDLPDCFFVDFYGISFQASVLDGFRQEVLIRDLDFFLHGVAWQGNDLHAVAQGAGYALQVVGRADKHDL